MSIKPSDLENIIIRPTLETLAEFDERMYTESAVALLMGTCAQESDLGYYWAQIRGPALGIFQVEPATHDSIWEHYLSRPSKSKLAALIAGMAPLETVTWGDRPEESGVPVRISEQALIHPKYCCAIARMVYWPKREPLPDPSNRLAQAEYWDRHYNANPYAGTVAEFLHSWGEFLGSWSSRDG